MTYITQNAPTVPLSMAQFLRSLIAVFRPFSDAGPDIPPVSTLSPRQLRDIGLTQQDAVDLSRGNLPVNTSMDIAQRMRLQSTNW